MSSSRWYEFSFLKEGRIDIVIDQERQKRDHIDLGRAVLDGR